MSGGSARQAMRHRCSILRDQGTVDSHGARAKSSWQTHLSAQPCFIFYRSARQQTTPGQIEAIQDLRLLLPLGTDVQDGDQIGPVTDRQGVTLQPGPFTIEGGIGRQPDHLALTLKRID